MDGLVRELLADRIRSFVAFQSLHMTIQDENLQERI